MSSTIEQNTDWYPSQDFVGFTPTNDCLIYRCNGKTHFRRLYRVDMITREAMARECIEVPKGYALRAVGSQHGVLCFVLVRYTTRLHDWQAKNQRVHGTDRRGKRVAFIFPNDSSEKDYGIISKKHWSI